MQQNNELTDSYDIFGSKLGLNNYEEKKTTFKGQIKKSNFFSATVCHRPFFFSAATVQLEPTFFFLEFLI